MYSLNWGPYAAFHGMALTFHNEDSMIKKNHHMNTSADVSKFKISSFPCLNVDSA
jgi:hypothetical protein